MRCSHITPTLTWQVWVALMRGQVTSGMQVAVSGEGGGGVGRWLGGGDGGRAAVLLGRGPGNNQQ